MADKEGEFGRGCSPGDAARVPKDFDCAVWLLNGDKPLDPGMALVIEPGDTAELHCFLEWKLPADAPAMLAVIEATFSLNQGDATLVQTEPTAFVLQSRPGILASLAKTPAGDSASAQNVLAELAMMRDVRSDGLKAIIRKLETTVDPIRGMAQRLAGVL